MQTVVVCGKEGILCSFPAASPSRYNDAWEMETLRLSSPCTLLTKMF